MAQTSAVQLVKKLNSDWQNQLNLAELSIDDKIDILGIIKRQAGILKAAEGFVKESVKSNFHDKRNRPIEVNYSTKKFNCLISFRERRALSSELVKQDVTDEWFDAHCKTTEFTECRIKELD